MQSTGSRWARGALAAAILTMIAGCGGDESTGPEYGDLAFSPASPVTIGLARQVDLELANLTSGSLGPIVLGAGSVVLSIPPGRTCPGLAVDFAPSQISSLPGGGSTNVSVTFSFAGLDEEECPFSIWAVDVNAGVGQQVLGSSQIRLDHQELE